MTTRSGATYNPTGDPTANPSSSNPSSSPPGMDRLENAIKSLANEMRTQFAKVKEDINETRSMANRRLNELEHPELSLQRNRRTPSEENRPSPNHGHRTRTPLVHSPPVQPEYRTPMPFMYGYPPPGYNPYYLEYEPPPPVWPHHQEMRRPFQERPIPPRRERYPPPEP